MFRYYFINREFIVSATARRVYRATATLSVSLLFFIIVIIAMRVAGAIPSTALPIIRLFLFIGVMGTAVTMVGMEYFLFGFDKSSANRKTFWFAVMMLLPLVGAPLYCFRVYSRSDIVMATSPEQSR